MEFNIYFLSKKSNSLGLQLADLVARPIGITTLRPHQKNQAFSIIENKLIRKDKEQRCDGMGLKIFPA